MGFIQVFSLEDKDKLILMGYRFLGEQTIGKTQVFLFEYHRMNFDKKDFENICRIILLLIDWRWSKMQITDVRIRKIATDGKMKAIVSVTFDNEFVIHDIKVIEGEKGLFIAMPSRKATDGEYRDIAHPINSGTREKIQTIILKQYEQAMAEAEAEEAAAEA